jgi:DNA primase
VKKDFEEFIFELLKSEGLRGIKKNKENINCECPFHHPRKNFTTFGISLSEDTWGVYNCFSCHENGNIFQLLMFLRKCSYKEAKRIIHKNVIIKPIRLDFLKKAVSVLRTKILQDKSSPIIELPPKDSVEDARKWLSIRNEEKQHGIMNIDFIMSRYELYYCNSGIFQKRIIMPIRFVDGNYVYFTNRNTIEFGPKYKFPPETTAENYLYGLYESLDKKKIVLVEGPFDVFQMKSFALENKIFDWGYVGNLGTVFSEARISFLVEFFDEVIILMDNDEAGRKSAEIGFEILSDCMKVRNLTGKIYPGKDPASSNRKQLEKVFSCF